MSNDYYPAWYLQDESKESASRIREYSADNVFLSIQDQGLKDSAAVLIVGNEVLAGRHKHDQDAQYLCEEIRKLGYEVKQVMSLLPFWPLRALRRCGCARACVSDGIFFVFFDRSWPSKMTST